MGDERWIIVPNWDKFQHYTDRTPPWIKLYLELNSDDAWLALTLAERGLLITIWVEFARSRGQLRVENVSGLCARSAREKHLASLNHAGFIQLSASKPSRAHAGARSKSSSVVPTELPERASKSAATPDLPSPQRQVPNAAAYGIYDPGDEPERDPDAAARMRELMSDLGVS